MIMTTPVGRHLAAVPIAFDTNRHIDVEQSRRIFRHMLLTPSIDALVVNANAGEVDSLTLEERDQVLSIAVEEAKRFGKHVVNGAVAFPASNEGAAQRARDSQKLGADAVLLVSPAGFARGVELIPDVMSAYVGAVSEAIDIPIIYFVAGAASGVNHTPEIVRRIVTTPKVVGIKDTMWTPQGFDANLSAVRATSKPVSVLSGNDNCLLQNFISGADGTLLVLHLVMGPAIIEMFDAVERGDLRTALDIHRRHQRLVELLFARPILPMPARIKHVLKLMGVIDATASRSPVPALTAQEETALTNEVEVLKLRSPLN
jgi:4-hydroxy-tetrahydrodipicolinate synthase